jgi:hypothetical protein
VVAPVGDASFYEAAPMAGQGGALGKRAAARDIAPPPQQASRSLAEAVARARAERKFTRGDYTTALKVEKANGEKVGSLEIDGEGLAEAVDKFALALTNKDYQMALRMSSHLNLDGCLFMADHFKKMMKNHPIEVKAWEKLVRKKKQEQRMDQLTIPLVLVLTLLICFLIFQLGK